MGRLTFKEPDGKWGIVGMNEDNQDEKVYGCLCKLLDYEETGLSPADVSKVYELIIECIDLSIDDIKEIEDNLYVIDKALIQKIKGKRKNGKSYELDDNEFQTYVNRILNQAISIYRHGGFNILKDLVRIIRR